MNFTAEQKLAIETRGKNILVSAAAGSGKTRILIERITQLVTSEMTSVDNMLIVTFTNAAAAEMKSRLRKSLDEVIKEDPRSEKAEFAVEQKKILHNAQISTFHAFAKNCIKRFFYLIDIEPKYRICDDSQASILKAEALDQLYEEEFEKMTDEFQSFLDKYSSGRNLYGISNMILSIYDQLRGLPYPWEWLAEQIEELGLSEDEFVQTEKYNMIIEGCKESALMARTCYEEAQNILVEGGFENLVEAINKDIVAFDEMIDLLDQGRLEECGALAKGFKRARLVCKKEQKQDYAEVKDIVSNLRDAGNDYLKDLKEVFLYQSLEDQIYLLNLTVEDCRTFEALLKSFDEKFTKLKKDKGMLDFNDLEHNCLEILCCEEAADYYKNKFEHIFVDEYQDTNVIQEEIISKITRGNNLFLVGDVKQSIYKFRLAEPGILMGKYKEYKEGNDENSMVIDLNKNFRSSQSVIDGINVVFESLMKGYDEDAKLHHGRVSTEYTCKPSLHIMEKTVEPLEGSDADEEIESLKAAELEAIYIGDLINKIIKEGEEEGRAIKGSDIAVLLRSVKNTGTLYYNIFKTLGIPAFIDDGDGYFDTIEISVFMNLLSVIDNRQQDVELISVLHSEIFNFTPKELAEIRLTNKNLSFFNAFRAISTNSDSASRVANGRLDDELVEKCKFAYDKITSWQETSTIMPLDKFLWFLMIDSRYYLSVGAMPAGRQRQENLRILIDKATNFSGDKSVSLYSFIKYIDAVKKSKVKIAQAKIVGEDEETVKIMTIHKSKGLEFPVVIVGGVGRRLNYTSNKEGVSMHKDLGFAVTCKNYEEKWSAKTILENLIAYKNKQEEIEEEERVLYVAMTRAEDQLHLVGSVDSLEKYKEECDLGIRKNNTYLGMLHGINIEEYWNKKIVSVRRLADDFLDISTETDTQELANELIEDVNEEVVTEEEKEEIKKILEFKYPRKDEETIISKYSVTELNALAASGNKKEEHFEEKLKRPKFAVAESVDEKQEEKGLAFGTAFHTIMEHIEFNRLEKEREAYIDQITKDLFERNLLENEFVGKIRDDKILAFIDTDLGKRCSKAEAAGTLVKEKEIVLRNSTALGQEVLAQGTIDCYFIEDDKVVLIDYKTNTVDRENLEAESKRLADKYRTQLALYKEALESGLGLEVAEVYLYSYSADLPIKVEV